MALISDESKLVEVFSTVGLLEMAPISDDYNLTKKIISYYHSNDSMILDDMFKRVLDEDYNCSFYMFSHIKEVKESTLDDAIYEKLCSLKSWRTLICHYSIIMKKNIHTKHDYPWHFFSNKNTPGSHRVEVKVEDKKGNKLFEGVCYTNSKQNPFERIAKSLPIYLFYRQIHDGISPIPGVFESILYHSGYMYERAINKIGIEPKLTKTEKFSGGIVRHYDSKILRGGRLRISGTCTIN